MLALPFFTMARTVKSRVLQNAREVASRAEGELTRRVPVRTGRMKRSIKVTRRGNAFEVEAHVPYAPYVVRYRRALRQAMSAARNAIRRAGRTIQSAEGRFSGSSYMSASIRDTTLRITFDPSP